MTVEWRPVVGYQGLYEVSSDGQVRRLPRVNTYFAYGRTITRLLRGSLLTPQTLPKGYKHLQLSKDGNYRRVYIHRLVLEAFVGPPGPNQQACHNNGDPADNRVENLRWGTVSDNNRDQVRHGTHPEARKTHCAHGHPYDEKNTRRTAYGRVCRRCERIRKIRRRVSRAADFRVVG